MAVYSCAGRTVATAATADHCVASLWNPDTAQRIKVLEIGVFLAADTDSTTGRPNLGRSTTRGTPGSTVTPDADNAWDGEKTPPSGALLDLATFTAQPTREAARHHSTTWRYSINMLGQGHQWVFWQAPMILPPGKGFGIYTGSAALLPAADVYFVWEED